MRIYYLSENNLNKKAKVVLLIIGINILKLIFIIEGYLTITKLNNIEFKLRFLLLVPIFSVLILKKQLFKYHYLALSICFIRILF